MFISVNSALMVIFQAAYYNFIEQVRYGVYTSWQRSMIVKTVTSEKLYLACSSSVAAGEALSANMLPAILSIIFEECRHLRVIHDYPHVDTLLRPDNPRLVDARLNSDDEELTAEGYFSDDPPTDDRDSSHQPESGSSAYSSPEPKHKQSSKRAQGSRAQPKRARSQKGKQVVWFSLQPHSVDYISRKLTLITSFDSDRIREEYVMQECHMPDAVCPTILYPQRLLGCGVTGRVYEVLDSNGEQFAIKLSQGMQ